MASVGENAGMLPSSLGARLKAWLCGVLGYALLAVMVAAAASLVTWNIADPSLTHAASGPTRNMLGPGGAIFSDLVMQLLGLAGVCVVLPPVFWALELIGKRRLDDARVKLVLAPIAVVALACAASSLPKIAGWPMPYGLGGAIGDFVLRPVTRALAVIRPERASAVAGLVCFDLGIRLFMTSLGLSLRDLKLIVKSPNGVGLRFLGRAWRRLGQMSERGATLIRREPRLDVPTSQHFGKPSAPAASAFGPASRAYPRSRPHHHDLDHGFHAEGDDDIDPNELERIIGICAPKSSARSATAGEDRATLLPPLPRSANADDPIRAAMQVMTAADEHAWQSPRASPPPGRFPEPPTQGPAHGMAERRSRPAAAPPEPDGWRPQSLPGGDDLYGRAVAIVLADRKASTGYLEQRLSIGYMRAADLIDRMEREGILGAPVYNGMRPILIGGPGSDEV
jgi:4TM region of DNA translocase FtsK/SpoIIIE/Ftsk gamma domain